MQFRDSNPKSVGSQDASKLSAAVVDAITQAIGNLHYGLVQLTIHDGKIVQLDVTQRRRF